MKHNMGNVELHHPYNTPTSINTLFVFDENIVHLPHIITKKTFFYVVLYRIHLDLSMVINSGIVNNSNIKRIDRYMTKKSEFNVFIDRNQFNWNLFYWIIFRKMSFKVSRHLLFILICI